jgi:hypothetical protein
MRFPLLGSILPVLGLAVYFIFFQYIKTYIENNCQVLFWLLACHYAGKPGTVTAQLPAREIFSLIQKDKTVGTTRFALK